MNYGCEGKVAFISGGTSGIGKAVAELLLKDGAEVWLLGRDAEKGTEAAVTLSAYGKVHYVQGDVKDLEACRSAAQNVREQRENIDLIVNAAGIYQERRLEKVTEYDFFSIMDTNVKGTIFLTQTLLPLLASEGAPRVRVNCICPGDVATPMLGKQLQQADGSYTLEDVEQAYPLERVGEPLEIAHVICSVLSPFNSFMTGSIIPVDGGLTAK